MMSSPNLVERVVRRLRSTYLSYTEISGIGSVQGIDEKFERELKENEEKLKPYYDEYISKVSRPDMACSLELSAFLLSFCKVQHVRKVADVGSGFSSFVLRTYAATRDGVEVLSVDDDNEWLKKTREFLTKHGFTDDNFVQLSSFLDSGTQNFDLILHDMNMVDVRINYLNEVFYRLAGKAWMVLDDVHKGDYRMSCLEKLSKLNVKVFNARKYTFDRYGRYAFLVQKQ